MRASFFLIVFLLSPILFAGEAMPKVVHQSGFSVVGIGIRTSNTKAATDGAIGKLWQRFFREDVLGKIPNKLDGNIYAVYSDYAGDHNGEYTLTLGAKVSDDATIPSGLTMEKIPAGNYALVASHKGPVAKVVGAAWQRVWDMEQKRTLGGTRAYKADFELYDQRAANPEDSQVDLHIGLK